MNVDKDEVTRHENVKNWWDINGPMMGLHAMNNLRISLIRNGLEQSGKITKQNLNTSSEYLRGIKIIDVGCGVGILSEPLARLGADVTGIEPSEELVNIAKQHAADNINTFPSPPTYLASTIEDHSSSYPNKYDALITSEVVEHVPDKQQFLDACVKTLKPGSSLFLTTPSKTLVSWFCNIFIAENVLKLLPKGIHDYNKFATPMELQEMLCRSGCRTVLTSGMLFNVLNRKWSWFPLTILHYAMHAIKIKKIKCVC